MGQKQPFLRNATLEDVDLLYYWVNDETVRKSAFHSASIVYEEHQRWFHDLIEDKNKFQFILMDENEPIGQIRLSVDGDKAEIDYSIALEKRGLGYGKVIVNLIQKKVYEDMPYITKLIAKVKSSNIPSICCFEKNGFSQIYNQYEFDMACIEENEADVLTNGG